MKPCTPKNWRNFKPIPSENVFFHNYAEQIWNFARQFGPQANYAIGFALKVSLRNNFHKSWIFVCQ